MAADTSLGGAGRPLDPVALARALQRLDGAAEPPWLHGEVARRMVQRLPVIRLQPTRVADWWSHAGASHALLGQAYRGARIVAVERGSVQVATARSRVVAPWWSPRRWLSGAAEVDCESEIAAGSVQLVWANMALHGVHDPQAMMRRWHRALAVEGFLMFSTLGPGTLQGLRALYASAGWPPPHAPFVDMHDLGDMLVGAGFADPVMDQESVRLTWSDPAALLAELRTLGANVDPRRAAGLRTPRWRRVLAERLAATAGADGRIGLDFELVYGHAFKPPPRPRVAARTEVPVEDLRSMARATRRDAPGAHGVKRPVR